MGVVLHILTMKVTLLKHPIIFLIVILIVIISGVLYFNISNSEEDSEHLTELINSRLKLALVEHQKETESRLRYLEEDAKFRTSPGRVESIINRKSKYPFVKILNESERKRILISGGAGFVGSHLVDRLMKDGHEVTVVDNFFTGRKRNVDTWIGHENFELINHDVVEPLMIEVDEIYHLASPASPVKYMYNPTKTIKTNTIGTLNMLGLAKRVKARILLASTSEVYGDPEKHPQSESYWGHVNPIGPRACYDEGKRVAETMMYAYAKQDHVDVRVARIFNTYGPRMHMYDGRVVSNFIMQALKGEDLTVFSPGNQTRSFMYVSDLINGLITLMNCNYTKPVNLGNPDEHTIIEFATIVRKETGSISKITKLPKQTDDPQKRRPDITLAKRVLNWYPVVSLEDGIRETTTFFKNELSKTNIHK